VNQRDRFLATLEMTVIQSFLNLSVLLLQHFIIPPTPLQPVILAHIPRHPREGGDPEPPDALPRLDSRLRGNDGEKSGCLNRWQFPVAAGC
jgi:hypothetical protein